MANSHNQQTLDLLLKCALCNTNLVNNQSKSLPCLHTFCTPCLTNKHQRFIQDDNIYKCPVCHTCVNRSSEDYSEITNNLKLDVIIEKLLHARHLQQSERHCEMCTREDVVVSNHWCQDCVKFLCDSCLVTHGKYKPKDKIIHISQVEDSERVSDFILPTKCSHHEEKFIMYCTQCKICLCSTCLSEHFPDENTKCVFAPIEKLAKDTKSQGKQLQEETCSYLEEEKEQIEVMKLNISDLKKQCSEKGLEIWEHIEETIKILKENACSLIAELEATTNSEINELEKLIQLKQDHIKEIEIIDYNCRQLLESFDNVDILLNYSRLKSKCDNLLTKPDTHVPSALHKIDMAYNFWYLQMHEMSKNIALGRCWKDPEWAEAPSSLGKCLRTKHASKVNLGFFLLPPVPYLGGRKSGELIDWKLHDGSCIFVTDENHLLVGCSAYGTLYEYNEANELYRIHEPKSMKFCYDLCRFPSNKMCIVDGNLILLKIRKNAPFLKSWKCKIPDDKYYSICNCFGKILVCDYYCRVHLLNGEGTIDRTILDIKRNPSPNHKIRCGPFRDTFLLFHYDNAFTRKDRKLFCYSLDSGACLFSVDVGHVCDLCTDKYGNIYIAEMSQIYVLSPDASEKYPLFDIKEPMCRSLVFIKDDIFYFASHTTGVFKLEKFTLLYHAQ